MMPKVWGKHFWMTIHLTALGYPSNPTLEDKNNYKAFYEAIGKVLPCKKCTLNFARHTSFMRIDNNLNDKKNMFNWTVYLHNSVNKELGRPLWNTDYAYAFYQNVAAVGAGDSDSGSDLSSTNGKNTPLYICVGFNVLFIIIITALILFKRQSKR